MAHVEVRNWEKFQHYKHRNPPWIRLYVALLDDPEFARLPDVTKAHLVACWMLAGRYHNKLPADLDWLATKMNATEAVRWVELINGHWIKVCGMDASELLATCKQNACTEQSRAETEILLPRRERRVASPAVTNGTGWNATLRSEAIRLAMGDWNAPRWGKALKEAYEREGQSLVRIVACIPLFNERNQEGRFRSPERFAQQLPDLIDFKFRVLTPEEMKHELRKA